MRPQIVSLQKRKVRAVFMGLNSDRMYHIDLCREDIEGALYAIVPGDPGRVDLIAKHLDNPRQIRQKREYNTYIGSLLGNNILVTSTGIGGPSAAIAVEELAMLGVKNFIRVGTCGGMQHSVIPGDLVIANASIRMDGTSKEYLPIEFPAVSDFELTTAMVSAAKKLDHNYHVGVVHCKDSFYGQHSPTRMPIGQELLEKWNAWIAGGALASEMESATLYTVAQTLNLRATTVLSCVWNQQRRDAGIADPDVHDTEKAIETAIEAIKLHLVEPLDMFI